MKHYLKTGDNSLWAFEPDGSQDDLITEDMEQLTPEQYASELQARIPPPPVPVAISMRQARLALLAAGHLASVEVAIDAMESPQREAARIEWEYATEVRRDNPLLQLLAPGLGLDAAALDAMFVTAASL